MAARGQGIAPPFPWYGAKGQAAEAVWSRLGDPSVYYEPFAGTLAVLLRRPSPKGLEYVGDADAFVANWWRAMSSDPEGVRTHVRWPMIEHDFRARADWLKGEGAGIAEQILSDPVWFDARIAGWWAWVVAASLHPTRWPTIGDHARGVNRGVSDAEWNEWFDRLAARVRRVHVRTSWQSALRDEHNGSLRGVFFDPPYKLAQRETRLYRSEVDADMHTEIEQWCLDRADDPTWRIVCAGFDGDFTLNGWEVVTWGSDPRERLWISPSCHAGNVLF